MGNNRKLQFAIRAALTAAAATAAVPAAMSQTVAANTTTTTDTTLQEVVVTGSRIAVAPNDISISPITTVTAMDIQQTGLIRTEDILNSLPQVSAEQGSGQSISSVGTSTVSLRDLGSQRTLVLVNGVRMNPGGAGGISGGNANAADVSQIPSSLIERVDVLTGGASAVYGADAVAGVVNFVLNTHYEGVKVDADYGMNMHNNNNQRYLGSTGGLWRGDTAEQVNTGQNKEVSILAGANFADGKGNATMYFTYLNSSAGSRISIRPCRLYVDRRRYACKPGGLRRLGHELLRPRLGIRRRSAAFNHDHRQCRSIRRPALAAIPRQRSVQLRRVELLPAPCRTLHGRRIPALRHQ